MAKVPVEEAVAVFQPEGGAVTRPPENRVEASSCPEAASAPVASTDGTDEAMDLAVGSGAVEAPSEDADIEAAIHAGDPKRAVTLLMARHGEHVFRFAVSMTRDPELAEEIRQQVFIAAYRDLASYAGRASLRAWLFGIAYHRCLDAVKKERRWVERFKNVVPIEVEPDDCDLDLDRDLDRDRLALIVATCLAKLAPASRNAVLMRYQQGLSYNEASAISGELAGTIQQRVARALRALRRCVIAQLRAGEA